LSQIGDQQRADAVSGGSLSRFSSKYFTSDISKQPALLNSIIHHQLQDDRGLIETIPVPSFKAEASSSSACCRFRKRDMGVRDRLSYGRISHRLQVSLFQATCIPREEKKTDRIHKNQRIHRRGEKRKRQEQERPNSTTRGETTTLELREGGREKTSTTLAKQR